MNNYTFENIKNTDKILQDNFFFDKDKLSVFLNNVYKIGKSDNYEILLSWKDKDTFSMLSIYSIYMLYSFMYDKNFLFSDFNLQKAIKCIYEDMIKTKDAITVKDIKENYIMKILKKILLNSNKKKKESSMSLTKHLQSKLNISVKEALLIETVAKEYLRKKKMKEIDWKKGVDKVKSFFGKGEKPSETQIVNDKIKKVVDYMSNNDKVFSQLKEVGDFFNIFKDEREASVTSISGMTHIFSIWLNVPKTIVSYAINYGNNYAESERGTKNDLMFVSYVKLAMAYASNKPNFKQILEQYIFDYYHVSKNIDIKEIEHILFDNIYQNVYKENFYSSIERTFKKRVELIRKYANSVDRYETRGETPQEKTSKFTIDRVDNTFSDPFIGDYNLQPSTLLNLYLHFYPNSNKFEFKDIFQYTKYGKSDEFISESKKSLKSYLQKRLTINSKEAELIESAVRKYVRIKRK